MLSSVSGRVGKIASPISVRSAVLGEEPEVEAMLDEEFVFSRGRVHGVRTRFPHLFYDRSTTIFSVQLGEDLAAAAALRSFRSISSERTYRGAMVGLVSTRASFRKRGLASALLEAITHQLTSGEFDFGVLWTTIPAFYEPFGWQGSDQGVFAEASERSQVGPTAEVHMRSVLNNDIPRMESLREQYSMQRVERSQTAYQALPIPAESMEFWSIEDGTSLRCYALAGKAGSTRYVYEIIGPLALRRELWLALAGAGERAYFNSEITDPLVESLVSESLLKPMRQSLAMWLPCSESMNVAELKAMYIPYFDRI